MENEGLYEGRMDMRVTLIDLVQIGMVLGHTGRILIQSGGQTGAIHFLTGQAVHAETPGSQGLDAFYQMVHWGGGHFMFSGAEPAVARTIPSDINSLLVEAARMRDEAARLGALGTEAPPSYDLTEMQAAYWDFLADDARRRAGVHPEQIAEAERAAAESSSLAKQNATPSSTLLSSLFGRIMRRA